jgi:hypothetical protein
MVAVEDNRIKLEQGRFVAQCHCGKVSKFSVKSGALKMLNRKNCRYCVRHYRNTSEEMAFIRKIGDKWGKNCSGCDAEQVYTRKDHAKQSYLRDWQCKKCIAQSKGFSANMPVGNERRTYNKFFKSAKSRNIKWDLTIEDMFSIYTGFCSMTNWEISITYMSQTASLDRIDSSIGYEVGNIQWVHTMVNMSKNKYDNNLFIKMCKDIAKNN